MMALKKSNAFRAMVVTSEPNQMNHRGDEATSTLVRHLLRVGLVVGVEHNVVLLDRHRGVVHCESIVSELDFIRKHLCSSMYP